MFSMYLGKGLGRESKPLDEPLGLIRSITLLGGYNTGIVLPCWLGRNGESREMGFFGRVEDDSRCLRGRGDVRGVWGVWSEYGLGEGGEGLGVRGLGGGGRLRGRRGWRRRGGSRGMGGGKGRGREGTEGGEVFGLDWSILWGDPMMLRNWGTDNF